MFLYVCVYVLAMNHDMERICTGTALEDNTIQYDTIYLFQTALIYITHMYMCNEPGIRGGRKPNRPTTSILLASPQSTNTVH